MDIYEILAILGALAWLPQLISFFIKYYTKPEVKIIVDKEIEIGYTSFGPIFNVQMALLAKNKSTLIRTIEIELTHENNETQKFTWDWFEETLYTLDIPESGLMPTKKNQKAIAININADSLVEKKFGFQQNSFKDEQQKLAQLATEEFVNIYNSGDDVNQIRSRNTFNNLRDFYKNAFNWKIGKYSAKIFVTLSDDQVFESRLSFQLTSLNIKTLEPNIVLAQKFVDKEFGSDVEVANNWLWVYAKKMI